MSGSARIKMAVVAGAFGLAVLSASVSYAIAADAAASAARVDPYKNFKFRLKWNGQVVAAVTNLTPSPDEIVKHRAGGDPSAPYKSPGRNKFEAITLERGITRDTGFSQWANQVWQSGDNPGSEVAPESFRKDIYLEVYNEAGELASTYRLSDCWTTHSKVLPTLDRRETNIAIEELKLACENVEALPPR